jgi:DNA-binding LacI/PurR family transcriptional regulator
MQFVDNIPKYMVIADIFRSKIEQGILRQGDKLFAGSVIAKQYNVDHRTVSAGLNVLVKEGILERVPGRGTIVKTTINTPVYLLIPCPDFLDENNNSAVFFRRLYKYLHLQLMRDGISVITVPMSPTNNPDDILEKYLDVIPEKAKVVCVGEWGLQGLECLKKRKCNVVFYDLQHGERSKLVDESWKKLIFDRAYGAYHAIKELAQNGFERPLFLIAGNKHSKYFSEKNIKTLEAKRRYFPSLPQENIFWHNESSPEEFLISFKAYIQNLDFDSVFFSNVAFADAILSVLKKLAIKGIISNDTTEIIAASNLPHYAADFNRMAKITVELFNQPDGTAQNIKPKLYNHDALIKREECYNKKHFIKR